MKVSIVIPVYNGAEFIRRSFDSCVYQTLKDIEIIAVNDCSPNPRDAEIMLDYEQQYPGKFRAMFHDTNKRQGGARNTGIRAARGEYFICVDQDDYIELDMCEKMYLNARDNDSDIVICDYAKLSDGKNNRRSVVFDIGKNEICEHYKNMHAVVIWCLLVKRELIINNALYMPECVTADDMISFFWYKSANKISRVKNTCYYYVDNKLSTSKTYPEHFEDHPTTANIMQQYSFYKNMLPDERKKIDEIIADFLLRTFCNHCTDFIDAKAKWQVYKPLIIRMNQSSLMEKVTGEIDKLVSTHPKEIKEKVEYVIVSERIRDLPNQKITIWGAGIRGKRLARHFSKLNMTFQITDKSPQRHGKQVEGIQIQPWNEVVQETNVLIVSPLNIYDEVVEEVNNPNIAIMDFRELMRV